MSKPVLHARVNGIMYDRNGEMMEVDVLDQGTGVMMFVGDDTDDVICRMYGEVSIKDAASVLYLLRRNLGERDFGIAMALMNMVSEDKHETEAEKDEAEE